MYRFTSSRRVQPSSKIVIDGEYETKSHIYAALVRRHRLFGSVILEPGMVAKPPPPPPPGSSAVRGAIGSDSFNQEAPESAEQPPAEPEPPPTKTELARASLRALQDLCADVKLPTEGLNKSALREALMRHHHTGGDGDGDAS